MVQSNHHSKSECLASSQPFKNRNTLNQNFKTFGIGMAIGFPSSGFEPPVYELIWLEKALLITRT